MVVAIQHLIPFLSIFLDKSLGHRGTIIKKSSQILNFIFRSFKKLKASKYAKHSFDLFLDIIQPVIFSYIANCKSSKLVEGLQKHFIHHLYPNSNLSYKEKQLIHLYNLDPLSIYSQFVYLSKIYFINMLAN